MVTLDADFVRELAASEPETRMRAALTYARKVAQCDAAMLLCRNVDGQDFSILINEGYSNSVAEFLAMKVGLMPEFARALRENQLLSWEDEPEFPGSYSAQEVLLPAGFRNGMTIALKDARNDVTGILVVNRAGDSFPTDHKAPIGSLNPLFAGFVSRSYERKSKHLSPREIEVMSLMNRGYSNVEIGRELFVSPKTVATHVEKILFKLDVSNRVAAVVEGARLGFFDADAA